MRPSAYKVIITSSLLLICLPAFAQELSRPAGLPLCPYDSNTTKGKCWGKYTFFNGDRYIGTFDIGYVGGGIGVMYYSNGNIYLGEVSGGRPYGIGEFRLSDGSKYIGNFKFNMHGKGVFVFSNGDKYEGLYEDGRRNGYGAYTCSNNDVYKGNWISDKYEGQGNFAYKDDEEIVGLKHKGHTFICDGKNISPAVSSKDLFVPPNATINKAPENLISWDMAKTKCEELGFKKESEGFGKCVLQLTK